MLLKTVDNIHFYLNLIPNEFFFILNEQLKEPPESAYWLCLLVESGLIWANRVSDLYDGTYQVVKILLKFPIHHLSVEHSGNRYE
jgi:hypothetical protein